MFDALRDVLAWAAVFNHALSVEEVHRYISEKASEAEVERALHESSFAVCTEEMWHFKTASFDGSWNEHRRANASLHLHEIGSVLAQLAASPTVEALAITGSVAAGVNDADGDVDLLIVAPTWPCVAGSRTRHLPPTQRRRGKQDVPEHGAEPR